MVQHEHCITDSGLLFCFTGYTVTQDVVQNHWDGHVAHVYCSLLLCHCSPSDYSLKMHTCKIQKAEKWQQLPRRQELHSINWKITIFDHRHTQHLYECVTEVILNK